MSNSAPASRIIIIRASRDTIGLVVAAGTMTFAMAYAVHAKHQPAPPLASPAQAEIKAPRQEWAGHLAELEPTTAVSPSEPMSSAAMVVPKAQLALPPIPAKPAVKRPCTETGCSAKSAVSTIAASSQKHPDKPETPKKTLLGMLNPLNHLPDASTVGRPFVSAGNTLAGWFKRL